MSRRTRRGRCLWNGIPRETSLTASYDSDEQRVPGSQSDSDSEEYQPVSVCVPALIPMELPVIGESFCQCPPQTEVSLDPQSSSYSIDCLCGEEEQSYDWVWDESCKSPAAFLSCSNRKVSFHTEYSCGTAAMRGTKELADGQHYWEIKMTSPVYGTDMMVGIGTGEVNLDQFRHSFCSLLGTDEDSWGLSYTGLLHHKGSKMSFSPRFGQGSIIGVHLDTWHGTLTFYKNRRCIGVAATRLRNKRLYPMVCSTAAKSSMKVIRSCSASTSLQYLCCSRLGRLLPRGPDPLSALPLPPGLRQLLHNQLGWLLRLGDAGDAGVDSGTDADVVVRKDGAEELGVCESPAPSYPTPAATYSTPYPDPVSYPSPASYPDHGSYLDHASHDDYVPYAAAAYPDSDSCSDHGPYADHACYPCPSACIDPALYSDPAPCPCCDTPLALTSCSHDAYCSSPAPLCAGPAPLSHPLSSLCQTPTCCPAPTQQDPASESDSDSSCSDPETSQRKRCRWT